MFNKEKVLYALKNNAFSKHFYHVNIDIADLFSGLARFTHRYTGYQDVDSLTSVYSNAEDFKKLADLVMSAVPEFQRDNDKWTTEMQSSFVLNSLKGMKTNPIVLYTLSESKTSCKILDGLQRLTAFYAFLIEKKLTFNVDGEILTSEEMLEIFDLGSFINISLVIYEFKTELEAVKHYIEFNENITHSSEDIERAKKYLKQLSF